MNERLCWGMALLAVIVVVGGALALLSGEEGPPEPTAATEGPLATAAEVAVAQARPLAESAPEQNLEYMIWRSEGLAALEQARSLADQGLYVPALDEAHQAHHYLRVVIHFGSPDADEQGSDPAALSRDLHALEERVVELRARGTDASGLSALIEAELRLAAAERARDEAASLDRQARHEEQEERRRERLQESAVKVRLGARAQLVLAEALVEGVESREGPLPSPKPDVAWLVQTVHDRIRSLERNQTLMNAQNSAYARAHAHADRMNTSLERGWNEAAVDHALNSLRYLAFHEMGPTDISREQAETALATLAEDRADVLGERAWMQASYDIEKGQDGRRLVLVASELTGVRQRASQALLESA